MRKVIGFVVGLILLLPVNIAQSEEVRLDGAIDAHTTELLSRLKRGDTLVVNSPGGNGLLALVLARRVQDLELNVRIDGRCMSACADFLLPAAKQILLGHGAVVGLHGSFISDAHILDENFPQQRHPCVELGEEWQSELWAKAGVRATGWKETTRRLQVMRVEPPMNNACGKVIYRHRFWYPTSKQLQALFGRKFIGALCADDAVCVNSRIRAQFTTGTAQHGKE
jgi:hypothetical protein